MGVLRVNRLFSLQKLSFSLWFPIAASLLIGGIVAALSLLGLLEVYEQVLYNWRITQRWEVAPSGQVAVVFVDDATLRGLADSAGRWPWPRDIWAAFQQQVLASARADCSVYDIVFDLPDQNAVNDQAFADTVRASGNVFLAFFFERPRRGSLAPSGQQRYQGLWEALPEGLRRSALQLPEPVHEELLTQLPDYLRVTLPLPVLLDAAAGCGAVTYHQDSDGLLRRFPLIYRYADEFFPSLPLLAAAHRLGVPVSEIQVVPGRFVILPLASGKTLRIPMDAQGQMLINFRSRDPGALPSLNLFAALAAYAAWSEEGEPGPLAELQDRVVILGSIAAGTENFPGTPLAEAYPATYVVATVVDNILKGDFLRETRPTTNVAIILLNALLVGIWSAKLRPAIRLALTLLQAVLYLQVSLWLFTRLGLCIPTAAPLVAIALPFTTLTLVKYSLERNARRYTERLFGKYLDRKIVDELIRHPEIIGLGGVAKHVSILFSDLCGFTSISETLSSQEVVEMLNEYFQEMAEAVASHGGMIDRYTGDAVMVVFGLPAPREDDALRAVRCALEMLERIEQRKAGSQPGYFARVNVRIGINSGEVTAGNIGSEQQQQYTVIGDVVNLAQRLEALAPTNGILISESTYQAVAEWVKAEPLGAMKVKGKQSEVQAYRVLGLKDQIK